MKKILEIFVIILILILAFLIIIKESKPKEEKNNNQFQNYTFYKEENLLRYENYYKTNNLSFKEVVLNVNIGLDNPFYSNVKQSNRLNTNYVIVNKYNYLPADYVPNNLIEINEYAKSNLYLNKEAYEAFKLMARDALLNNLHLRIISAYRSYTYQEKIYNNYLSYDKQTNVDTYSARKGHSEHQTGLAVDLDNTKTIYTNFENTDEFAWLKNNCYKYGFILRYPKDKEHITGYIYEPWHYRYIGIKESTYIHKHNLTYEEYYYQFLD